MLPQQQLLHQDARNLMGTTIRLEASKTRQVQLQSSRYEMDKRRANTLHVLHRSRLPTLPHTPAQHNVSKISRDGHDLYKGETSTHNNRYIYLP
jgi:hypothetical protein